MSSHLWWYVARSSGLVAWLFSGTSIVTGFVLASKAAVKVRRANWQTDLHRIQGAIVVGALLLHIAALVADSYVRFDLVDVLVPMRANWRPGAVAWGIVAFYVLLIVELSSLVKNRIPKRWWHGIHLTSLLAFGGSTVHAFQAGTDARRAGIVIAVLVVVAASVGAGAARWTHRGALDAARAAASPAPRARVVTRRVAEVSEER